MTKIERNYLETRINYIIDLITVNRVPFQPRVIKELILLKKEIKHNFIKDIENRYR